MARPVKMAEAAARREDKRATIACYQDDVNLVATPRAESLARSTFIEEMEKIGLVVHKVSVFTPLGGQPHPDRQLRQESRALILRYGAPCPVPALQDDSSEGDTMTRRDSQEVQQLLDKRSGMAHRLLQLRDAGLPTQFALAMFRHSLHEHAAFHHEHRERPGSYHHSNHMCTSARRRHFGGNSLTHFQPSTTWRVGYVECHHHSTANSSQGWAQCWRVFEITPILPTRTTSTLKHCTPWHSKSIKAHYPRRAWRVLTNRNFNLWQATAGPQPTRTPRAEMDDETFIVAARLRIGIPMGDHVTHCHKIYDDTICGAELDETRIHALISQLQGSTVHRHNRIRDTTAHILREADSTTMSRSSNWCRKRQIPPLRHEWDIIAHGPLGQRDLIVVTVACAHTPTALRCGSGTRLGACWIPSNTGGTPECKSHRQPLKLLVGQVMAWSTSSGNLDAM